MELRYGSVQERWQCFFSLNKFEYFLASDKAADDCSYLDLLWLTSAVFRKNVKVEGGPRTLSTVMREPSCPHTPGTCSSSDCITAGGVANPVALSSPLDWLRLEKTANRPQMTLLRKTADTSWNIQEETPYFVGKKIYTFRCIQNLFEVSVLKSWGRVEEAKLRAGVSVCDLIRFHAKNASRVQNQGLWGLLQTQCALGVPQIQKQRIKLRVLKGRLFKYKRIRCLQGTPGPIICQESSPVEHAL